jgi:large subunit ribosomal protein L21
MKKAVIACGGVQYLVAKGDELVVNYLGEDDKVLSFTPLMIAEGKDSIIDKKKLETLKVKAKVLEQSIQGEKVLALRYKAKKRVHTKRGHRQKLTKIQITSV